MMIDRIMCNGTMSARTLTVVAILKQGVQRRK